MRKSRDRWGPNAPESRAQQRRTAALGVQTANLIFDLADNGRRTEDHPVELPLSTVKVLDVRAAKQFGLRSEY